MINTSINLTTSYIKHEVINCSNALSNYSYQLDDKIKTLLIISAITLFLMIFILSQLEKYIKRLLSYGQEDTERIKIYFGILRAVCGLLAIFLWFVIYNIYFRIGIHIST